MTLIKSVLSGSSKPIHSHNVKKDIETFIIPKEVSYKYLRCEIMLGNMPVNTVVKINIDYYDKKFNHLFFGNLDSGGYDDIDEEIYILENFIHEQDDDDDYDDDDNDYNDDYDYYTPESSVSSGKPSIDGEDEGDDKNEDDDEKEDDNEEEDDDEEVDDNEEVDDDEKEDDNEEEDNDEDDEYKQFTIIFWAMLQDDDEFVDFLLDNQVDLWSSTADCGPIVYAAISMRKYNYLQRILEDGFPVNYRGFVPQVYCWDPISLLDFAIKLNDFKMVEYLLSMGAQINLGCNDKFLSPLQKAIHRPSFKMMKFLIERGAHITYDVLISACASKDLKIIQFIMTHPAFDLDYLQNIKRSYKNSVLSCPLWWTNEEALTFILDAGVDVNFVKNSDVFYDDQFMDKNCVMIIKKHIIRLMVAGIPVCNEAKKVKHEDEFQDFCAKCEEEVETLKWMPVSGTDLTCFDLLHKSRDELTSCLQNFDNCINIKEALEKAFPVYGGMMAYRIIKSTKNFWSTIE